MLNRRVTLIAAFVAAALLGACNGKPPAPVTSEDVSLGNPNAPVKVIEYHSITCPYCARFNEEIFPQFKEKYIDSGQVFYTSREVLGHNPAFAAAGYLTARCAGEDKYFAVIDALYQQQTELMMSGDYANALRRIAQQNGLSKAAFEACIADPAAIEAVRNRNDRYVYEEGHNSTPTFIINGQKFEGVPDMAQLDERIAEAKARGPAPAAATPAAPVAPATAAPATPAAAPTAP